jgi:hypothetical protein
MSNYGTTTLNRPDFTEPAMQAERINALPRLSREKDGPVFAEPWQAQAFALAVKLSEQGHFSWKEWAETLGENFGPPPIVASPTTGRTTMNIGWQRLSAWWSPRDWLTARRWRCARKLGPMPTGTHLMETQ